jgi:hypothetical protein
MRDRHEYHSGFNKINTIQKEITAINTEIDYNHESIKKLNRALVEYFFEK